MHFTENPVSIIYGIIVLFLLIALSVNDRNMDFALSVTICFLFSIIYGSRDINSGTDTSRYYQLYNNIMQESYSSTDLFFWAFTKAMRLLKSPEFYIYTITLAQLILLFLAGVRLKIRNLSLYILSYVSFLPGFDLMTNGLRQGLALSVVVFALSFDHARVSRSMGIFFATQLHKSAWIFLPFLLLRKAKEKYRKIVVALVVCLFVYSLFGLDISNIIRFLMDIGKANNLWGSVLLSKLYIYSTLSSGVLSGEMRMLFLGLSILLFLFSYYFSNKKDDGSEVWFLFGSTIQILFLIMNKSAYSYRFFYIAYPLYIISISISLNKQKVLPQMLFMICVVIGGILTFGSKTFREFSYIFF